MPGLDGWPLRRDATCRLRRPVRRASPRPATRTSGSSRTATPRANVSSRTSRSAGPAPVRLTDRPTDVQGRHHVHHESFSPDTSSSSRTCPRRPPIRPSPPARRRRSSACSTPPTTSRSTPAIRAGRAASTTHGARGTPTASARTSRFSPRTRPGSRAQGRPPTHAPNGHDLILIEGADVRLCRSSGR